MANMNWITWVTVLVLWPLAGLGVAYLFGRFICGVESPENAGDLIRPVVSYLRPKKRTETSSHVRVTTHTRARREAAGGQRGH